ncbi:MAG: HlyC/CorC family transporter [Clostridia bacterium]|nr:HlyC/CorC family transporter [Clostridia bacterium]
MDSSLWFVLVILICFSAYFSASETAFSSFNRARMKNMAQNGNKKAALALNMSENFEKLISTLLIGNNIVNISASTIATLLFAKLIADANLAATTSTVVMTLLILIFGEITPKSMAKQAPEAFAMFSAPFLNALCFILTPLSFFFMTWQKKIVNKVFDFGADDKITEDELLTIVDEAQQDGGINIQESELIKNAIEFNDIEVHEVLTPRVDVVAIDVEWDKEKIAEIFDESGFSRLPVYKDTIDNIIGVLTHRDFVLEEKSEIFRIESAIKPVKFIFSTMKISKLLRLLQENKSHIVVVSDEYGGTEGIVTLEDIIEALVGEIWDEYDSVEQSEFEKISDDVYKVNASATLEDMFEFFELRFDEEENDDINTVGGFVASQLEKIPDVGDTFEYEHLKFTVTSTDSARVLSVLVKVGERVEKEED